MQAITGYTQREFDARGICFRYLEWGDASSPPMVLLHGLTGHAHTWDHMAPALAERFHVVALDQRGHGDSEHAATYGTGDFVEDVEAFAEHLGLRRFVLMGLSMGGHNAMAYAAAYPQRVSRLIIIDIPPKMDREYTPNWPVISKLAETGHAGFDSFEQALEAARAGNPTAPEENLRYRTEWNLTKTANGKLLLKWDAKAPAAWAPADLWPLLPSISVPTLLVRGGKTLVLPRETAQRMIASLPDAELIEVPDSGHSVPTDRPEELQQIVLDWLAKRSA
ncbi:MAG: alpha/beta hydrolase [Chloroflexota bacterium]|nr:alpha/beta hydrolase [Chloroflexota bacterium]